MLYVARLMTGSQGYMNNSVYIKIVIFYNIKLSISDIHSFPSKNMLASMKPQKLQIKREEPNEDTKEITLGMLLYLWM